MTPGWFVEFGAWDGVHLSNTRHLIENGGWNAVLIEASTQKFAELEENSRAFPGVTCLRRFVTFDPPDNLDGILAGTAIPADFELLSIDMDGNDFHIWGSLRSYRPKIVLIEINPTMPNHVDFVQARDMSVQHRSSLAATVRLGRHKG